MRKMALHHTISNALVKLSTHTSRFQDLGQARVMQGLGKSERLLRARAEALLTLYFSSTLTHQFWVVLVQLRTSTVTEAALADARAMCHQENYL